MTPDDLARRQVAIDKSLAEMRWMQERLGIPSAPVAANVAPPQAFGADELTTMAIEADRRIIEEHVENRTLHEAQLIPKHDDREDSLAYRQTHDHLVHDLRLGCVVCGVRFVDLNDQEKNPFVATQIETHHRMIEWSLSNAVDVDRFNERVLPGLLRRSPDRELYQRPLARAELLKWIDSDADNMWVLCDVHHRHLQVGIHMVSGPIWGPQDLLLPQFQAGRPATTG